MSIPSQLKSLDKLIAKGKIIEAFDKYFDEKVVTFSSDSDKTSSKKEKMKLLKAFFNNIASMDQIKFHDHIVHSDLSYSKFTFIFTNKQNERLKWHEIIRRKWKGETVVEEFYYHEKFSKLKERLEEKQKEAKSKNKTKSSKKITKPSKKEESQKGGKTNSPSASKTEEKKPTSIQEAQKPTTTAKTANKAKVESEASNPPAATPTTVEKEKKMPAASAKTATESKPSVKQPAVTPAKKPAPKPATKTVIQTSKTTPAKAVKTTIKPATTARKPRTKKAPDLTIVEGIGPKIKELLGLGGIKTFAQLASAEVANMKAILLEKGGTRYNIHDPATWPEQAALARDGKWEELEKLKTELKGGKR